MNRAEKGEIVLAEFMTDLSALYYLEKGDIEGARHMLRLGSESAIVASEEFGTPVFDRLSMKGKGDLFQKYRELRDKYGPIDYRDDGYANKKVEDVLNKYTYSVQTDNQKTAPR